MAKGTIECLKLPVSLGSGEYPLLSSSTQSLTEYVVHSVTGYYTEDLAQTVTLAYFQGYGSVSMLRFGGRLYWVTDVSNPTNAQNSVRFQVSLCAPSSFLFDGTQHNGEFSALPFNACPWLKRQAVTGDIRTSRSVELPSLGEGVYWLEVVSSTRITQDSEGTATKTEDTLSTYGMFVGWNPVYGVYEKTITYDGRSRYPYIAEIMNSPEVLGLQASTIISINISARCPYQHTKTGTSQYVLVNGESITPGLWTTDKKAHFYGIDSMRSAPPLRFTDSVTVTLSALERASGTVTIRNEQCNAVYTIPTSWGSTFTLDVQAMSDYSGIVTYITMPDGSRAAIQEGHLPYVGSAWSEYQAYSQAFDRQAMQNSIDYANQRMMVSLAQGGASAVQGALTGAITGAGIGALGGLASFGLSAAGSLIERDISEREARDTQELAERRVQGQAGTAYNAGYGTIYFMNCLISPACVQIDMPANLTSTKDAEYTAVHGYPAEGPQTVEISEGYYKGRIFATETINGVMLNKLNDSLRNGILFRSV